MNKEIPNAFFQVSLKVMFKNKKDEMLILGCPDSSSMCGYYDFPGGRIRQDEIREDFLKIINREVEEELGDQIEYKITEKPVAIGRHLHKEKCFFWIIFEAEYLGGEIKISDEHFSAEWVAIDKDNYKDYFIMGSLEAMKNYFLSIP